MGPTPGGRVEPVDLQVGEPQSPSWGQALACPRRHQNLGQKGTRFRGSGWCLCVKRRDRDWRLSSEIDIGRMCRLRARAFQIGVTHE